MDNTQTMSLFLSISLGQGRFTFGVVSLLDIIRSGLKNGFWRKVMGQEQAGGI